MGGVPAGVWGLAPMGGTLAMARRPVHNTPARRGWAAQPPRLWQGRSRRCPHQQPPPSRDSLVVRLLVAPAVAVGVGATGHLPLCPYPLLRSHPVLPCPLATHPETRRLLVLLHPTAACPRRWAHCLRRGWLTTHKSDIPGPLLSDINVTNQTPCDQTSRPLQEAPRTAPYQPVPPQQNRQFQRCSSGRCVEGEEKGLPFHVRSASV